MAENDHTDKAGAVRWMERALRVWRSEGVRGIGQRIYGRVSPGNEVLNKHESYKRWIELYDTLTDSDRQAISARIDHLDSKPMISVVMPVYNSEETWLRRAIESVQQQLYSHWELCIADDCSPDPYVRQVLEQFSNEDRRIKVVFRRENGHISAASNSALELATGEFVALLDHDDELPEHALYMVAEELNAFPEADLIYSDEDKLNANGERVSPHFKTDWNPDLFYSLNFISHLGVYRRQILQELGGFREGYEGSQDYDLALRVVERIPERNIRHIPHVLYHWRELPTSVGFDFNAKSYAHENARRAIRSHFERIGKVAKVVPGYFIFHRAIYPIPRPAPLVSLIFHTEDLAEPVAEIEAILEQTDYASLEVIIVGRQTAPLDSRNEGDRDPRIRMLTCDDSFSRSAMCNWGVQHANGKLVGFLDNNLRVVNPDWLREMASHALRPEIGAVGGKIVSVEGTIERAGIILGIEGGAGHAFKGLPADSEGYVFRAQVIQNYSAVSGACLVMRREVFVEVGGLDEANFPSHFDDVDLCLRIGARGHRVLWTCYASLSRVSPPHAKEPSQCEIGEFDRAIERLRSRWDSITAADPYYNPNLTLEREDFSLSFPPRMSSIWKRQRQS